MKPRRSNPKSRLQPLIWVGALSHLPFPEYIIRIPLVRVSIRIALVRVELHSLGLGVSVSPLFALVSVELHYLSVNNTIV